MDQETTVAKAQDDILHDNLPIAIGMAVGVASLFAYVFLDARGIIPWLLYMITVFALRWASSLIGWRNSSDADHRSWRRIYGLGAVMTALGWSAASPLFILKADVPHQAYGILLLVGTAAGAGTRAPWRAEGVAVCRHCGRRRRPLAAGAGMAGDAEGQQRTGGQCPVTGIK